MAQTSHSKDFEKTEAAAASVEGGRVEAATTGSPQGKRSLTDGSSESATTPDEARDLEELAPVQSGPVYSVFGKWQKRYIISMVTWAAFISPTSASIYFPALNPLQANLKVSNALINLTLTSYLIFQGLAPTLFGDFADMAGRRPAYIIAFTIHICANVGLALQNSYPALLILRCLQSSGGSGAIALGYGSVADISTSAERGKYMGFLISGAMMGPTFGPVLGGILVQFLGWRSIFWFMVITAACFLIPFALTVPETGRNVVGNGSIPPQGWNMTILEWLHYRKEEKSEESSSNTTTTQTYHQAQRELSKSRKLRLPNPLKTIHIILEKDVRLILIYNSLLYVAFYDILASIPLLFQEIYHFNDLQIGLCYLPFGVGCAIATVVNGRMLDRNYAKVAREIGFTIDRKRGDDMRHFPIERARLELIWPMLVLGSASMVAYGWVLEKNCVLAAPLILQFFIGIFVNGAFNILCTLIVDLYPQSPSTVTAANNLVRCFMGAAGTAVINLMIKGMGRGWCFTFVAGVVLLASPMLWVELRWGPGWREERRVRLEEKKEREAEREKERNQEAGGQKESRSGDAEDGTNPEKDEKP